MSLDKRCYTRYDVPVDSLFVAGRNTGILAMVKNISTAGLAFEYQPFAGEKPDWTEIDIFTTDDIRFRLSEIPCKIIYDIVALPENSSFRGSKSRIVGLQYVGLSNEHQVNLDYMINSKLYPPI